MLKTFEKRALICYFLLLVAMFALIMRIVNIAFDPKLTEAAGQTGVKTVTVGRQRGTIFDCNMKPITNGRQKYITLITEPLQAAVTLTEYFSGNEIGDILGSDRGNIIITTDKNITGSGVMSFPFYENSTGIAEHLIGYTDESGHGVSGLEAVFDEQLYSDSVAELSFGIDGLGRLIKGDSVFYRSDPSVENSGVMLTIDSEIQKIAEQAAEKLLTGAVVVSEVETGEIKAMVSRPGFDIDSLAEAVNDENSPLLNRAMLTYNVGSGFKPCVAAAALEAGEGEFLCFCEGRSDIDGQMFRCHKSAGHKWLDMAGAVKHSCNAYFYSLAIKIGASRIYKLAELAGFNNAVSFGYGISTKSSQIGNLERLRVSDRALANLAIGQGELMVSPVGILTLYSAVAGDGSYAPLKLIRGEVENLTLVNEPPESGHIRLMSKGVADALKKCLLGVLDENGTGHSAKPKTVTAAGKTSTAETGIIKNGKSVVNTWFCGFFPFEEPKYAVAVLNENSEEGCGSVFAEIADNISATKNP